MKPTPADPTNTDTPPECREDCPYQQKFNGFDLQCNALRMETASIINPCRCGWNLKPGLIGGRPLDYAECVLVKAERGEGR